MAKDILKEAIADAKAVREVALANAKAALEEAFTPKLQSMLSAKLSETLNEEEEDLEENYMDEMDEMDMDEMDMDEMGMDEMDMDEITGMDEEEMGETADLDEEIDLEEILNELELEEDDDSKDETVDEVKDMDEETMDEAKDEEEEKLDEMEVNYSAETANRAGYAADYVHEGNEKFDLDALLEEINNLDETEEEVNEGGFAPEMGKYSTEPVASGKGREKVPLKGESWEEYISRVPDSAWIEWFKKEPGRIKANFSEGESVYEELEETQAALETVRTELNEVNLLNSKLLYVNRIFKANTLDEGQKLRVVETLDKAETAKEAKLIYETIKDTFTVANTKKKSFRNKTKSLKEGIGMASKTSGTTQSAARNKEVIAESGNMVNRFQKLANIKINQ